MKKFALILVVVLLVCCLSFIFVACGDENNETEQQEQNDYSKAEIISAKNIVFDGTTGRYTVPNATTTFSFINEIKVSKYATWQLCADITAQNVIPSKTVTLEEGDNTFYILVTSGDGKNVGFYTVIIRRRPIYTVTFNSNGGTPCENQYVEEDGYAIEQTSTKRYCELVGWDWNFENAIKEDIIINAIWLIVDEIGKFIFTETEDEFVIDGLVDDTITSIVIPDYATRIALGAFDSCTSLQSVNIGNGVTTIGILAFYGCENLSELIIGNNVQVIGDCAFRKCSSLTRVVLPESLLTIGEVAFADCTNLEEIIIPDSVTTIRDAAFHSCVSLENVTIGKNSTSIGNAVFYGCSNLTTVKWGAINCTVAGSIDYPIFEDCFELCTIEIENGVTCIPAFCFIDCENVTNITIPNSITIIGDAAFAFCIGLLEIIIPENVAYIGDFAFYYCLGLIDSGGVTNITYNGTLTQWDKITKGENWILEGPFVVHSNGL